MECDYSRHEVVRAGGVELPSGHLLLEVGKCFFRRGLLKASSFDEPSDAWQSRPKGRFDEATVSVNFRVVGDLVSLSMSEVSLVGPGDTVLIPEGPPHRAEIFDTVAEKIRQMVLASEIESSKVEASIDLTPIVEKLVSSIEKLAPNAEKEEIMAVAIKEIYKFLK